MRNITMLVSFFIITVLALGGCGKQPAGKNGEIVARINNYELTVEDFKSEVDPILAKRYMTVEPDLAKKALLEDIITKKILIEAAQKENFDKDSVFMKEIERYWEQALLKLLLKKKIDELSQQGIPADDEKKMQQALSAWVKDLRRKAKVEINEEVLEEIEIN